MLNICQKCSQNLSFSTSPKRIFLSIQRANKTIGVPDTAQVTGMCGGGVATTQSVTLMFYGDWLLNFIISHSLSSPDHLLMDGTTYGIKEISLEYNLTSLFFPDADNIGKYIYYLMHMQGLLMYYSMICVLEYGHLKFVIMKLTFTHRL